MNNPKRKKILIVGTGAVGGYYGGMLAKKGYDVTFIARGANYKALKEKRLTLTRDGVKEIIPINVVEICHGKSLQETFDYVFICVKSAQTEKAIKSVINNINENTSVISFQNGVENEEIISNIIGVKKTIGAIVFVAAQLTEPGVIFQSGYNGAVIGELTGKITDRISEIQKMLLESGIDCKITENIQGELWNKLVWNASFNPLSVITGKTVDKLLAEDYNLVKDTMTEVKDVAIALGLNIRPDTVEFNLNRSKGFIGFKTSMLQDFERGKSIEIEELVGIVIRKAKEKNISVPNIQRIYNEIKQKITTSHVTY